MAISLSEIKKAIPVVPAPALGELVTQMELALSDLKENYKREERSYMDVLNELRRERKRRGTDAPNVERIVDSGFVRYNLLGLARRKEILNPEYDWMLIRKWRGRTTILDYMQIHMKVHMMHEDLDHCNLRYTNDSAAFTYSVEDALKAMVAGATLNRLVDTRKAYSYRVVRNETYFDRLFAGRREGASNESGPDIIRAH